MKKLLLFSFAGFLATSVAMAKPIDLQAAKKVADTTLSQARGVLTTTRLVEPEALAKTRGQNQAVSSAPAYYLFSGELQPGYVIVAGDDAFPSVFGYSTKGTIAEDDVLPEALVFLLDSYSKYVDAVRSGEVAAPAATAGSTPASSAFPPKVDPLLTTTWGQGSPYNLLCPKTAGGNSVPCGCVATAMAQVMYFWKHPAQGRGRVAYTSSGMGGTIRKDLSESYYHWELMHDTKAEMQSDNDSRNTISELCYDCGISVAMNYNTDGSGAYDDNCMRALVNNFSYKASVIEHLNREYYATKEEWLDILKTEFCARRPVLYSAYSANGGGHAFVLDGYDTRNFVHVNWGWDGGFDGCFDIALLNPGNYEFSIGQSAIIRVIPDEEGTDVVFPQTRVVMKNDVALNRDQVAQSQSFRLITGDYANSTLVTKMFKPGLGLFDKHGNFLEEIYGEGNYVRLVGNSVPQSGESMRVKIPAKYGNGDYQLRVVFMEQGFDEWLLPYVVGGQEKNIIRFYIEDGQVYFNQVSTGIDDILSDSSQKVISSETYDATGRRISNGRGLVIRRVTMADGSVRTMKYLRR